jgi:hypothetical protein
VRCIAVEGANKVSWTWHDWPLARFQRVSHCDARVRELTAHGIDQRGIPNWEIGRHRRRELAQGVH